MYQYTYILLIKQFYLMGLIMIVKKCDSTWTYFQVCILCPNGHLQHTAHIDFKCSSGPVFSVNKRWSRTLGLSLKLKGATGEDPKNV